MATDEERFVAKRDFERDIAEIRKNIASASDQAERAEEGVNRLQERFKYGLGLDLASTESTSRFKAAVDWAARKVKKLDEVATQGASDKLVKIFTAAGAFATAAIFFWPLIRRIFDAMVGPGH